MPFIVYLIFFAIVLIIAVLKRSENHYRPHKFPPGPTQWPIVGNLLPFRKSPLRMMTTWKGKYGKIVGLRLGEFRVVQLNDYDQIKAAFSNPAFNGRPDFKPALLFSGGNHHGTLTSDGDPWDNIRRFTIKNLNNFGFGKKSTEGLLLFDIQELLCSLQKRVGCRVNFKDKFYIPAINHLWHILMGETIPEEKVACFKAALISTNKSLWHPIGSSIWFMPWLSCLFPGQTGLKKLAETLPFLQNIVKQGADNKFTSNPAQYPPTDLMGAFVHEIINSENTPESHFHKTNGEHHARSMVLNLFVTAAEAVTNSMNWALLYLSLYENVQDQLADEILSVIGTDRMPTLSDMTSMPYTKAVMQEVLRIASTSPFSNFQMTTEDVWFEGYFIPKGTTIIANLYGIHHDEKYYPEPELFNPERFIKNQSNVPPPPFIPFSVGLRTCLGQTFARNEIFLMMTGLCQRFKFVWNSEEKKPTIDELTDKSHVSIFRFTPDFELVVQNRVPAPVAG